MKAIYDGGSNYCVPTSLSTLSGKGTSEITRLIQGIRKSKRQVKGVMITHSLVAMKRLGIQSEMVFSAFLAGGTKPRLHKWLSDYQRKGVTYLITVTSHMLIVKDGDVYCTQFAKKGGVGKLSESRYLFKQVNFVWIINNPPESSGTPRELAGRPLASFNTNMGTINIYGGSV